jgi:hypothetical protein
LVDVTHTIFQNIFSDGPTSEVGFRNALIQELLVWTGTLLHRCTYDRRNASPGLWIVDLYVAGDLSTIFAINARILLFVWVCGAINAAVDLHGASGVDTCGAIPLVACGSAGDGLPVARLLAQLTFSTTIQNFCLDIDLGKTLSILPHYGCRGDSIAVKIFVEYFRGLDSIIIATTLGRFEFVWDPGHGTILVHSTLGDQVSVATVIGTAEIGLILCAVGESCLRLFYFLGALSIHHTVGFHCFNYDGVVDAG